MQIKYLKNAPLGAIGEIHEVPDYEARVLITLGFAEPMQAAAVKPKRTKKTTPTLDLV